MKAADVLRQQFKFNHDWLEGTMEGVDERVAHWGPPANATPVGAHYVHAAIAEDYFINGMIKGGAPLLASTFEGKLGISEMQPMEGRWDEWARRVKVDVPAARAYAQAVYAATDDFLASADDEALNKPVDMSFAGMGQQTALFLINIVLNHTATHTGEISSVKGLQGLKGYPM